MYWTDVEDLNTIEAALERALHLTRVSQLMLAGMASEAALDRGRDDDQDLVDFAFWSAGHCLRAAIELHNATLPPEAASVPEGVTPMAGRIRRRNAGKAEITLPEAGAWMAASRGPGIGRPGRPPWAKGDFERFQGYHGLAGPPAVERLLAAPVPVDNPAPKSRRPPPRVLHERAAQLADLLEPLPAALDEIATRISRHCARTDRDAELARVVEAVRERTFALSRAVHRLAEAAGKEGA